MTKHRFALIAAGPAVAGRARAGRDPSPREIMEKVTVTRKLDGSEAVVKMTVVDDKKQARERDITMATKLYDGGKTEKRIYRFLSPADVQGTACWCSTTRRRPTTSGSTCPRCARPAASSARRDRRASWAASSRTATSNIPAIDDFDYTLVKQEPFGGETCYVIDVAPKNKDVAESEGYSKKTYWVSKDKFAVMRGLFYDKDGKLLKELITGNVKLLDAKNKRYRPMHMEMINKQNGRRSVFDSSKVTFAPNTKDEFFTTAYLERS